LRTRGGAPGDLVPLLVSVGLVPIGAAMTDQPPAVPDGFDFDPAFLRDPAFLPLYVHAVRAPRLSPSRRAELADVKPWFRLTGAPPDHVERKAHTIALPGAYALFADPERQCHDLFGEARLVLPEELLNRHLLFVGPPGVGKTTQAILPLVAALIADHKRSVVVFDPKGDLFGIVRALSKQAGRPAKRVLRLNLTDPQGSLGWNPLRRGMDRTEAHGIASSLVLAVESKHSHDSPYWRNNSIELIAAIGMACRTTPTRRCRCRASPRSSICRGASCSTGCTRTAHTSSPASSRAAATTPRRASATPACASSRCSTSTCARCCRRTNCSSPTCSTSRRCWSSRWTKRASIACARCSTSWCSRSSTAASKRRARAPTRGCASR
jgi:hypothetical protein